MSEALSEVTDVVVILRQWEDEHQNQNYDPVPTLTRLACIIETETENYQKMDPDPFDDRHPSRADPDCAFGHILKVLFKKDNFMNKLVSDYLKDNYWRNTEMNRDALELNTAACRLLLDIMAGLETSVVFQETDGLIMQLFSWAENGPEPIQNYATGLLAAAMEVQDITANFREQNSTLVPIMLERLHILQNQFLEEKRKEREMFSRPFAHLRLEPGDNWESFRCEKVRTAAVQENKKVKTKYKEKVDDSQPNNIPKDTFCNNSLDKAGAEVNCDKDKEVLRTGKGQNKQWCPNENDSTVLESDREEGKMSSQKRMLEEEEVSSINKSPRNSVLLSPRSPDQVSKSASMHVLGSPTHGHSRHSHGECSNSSWVEMESNVIGSFKMHPLTDASKQILILRYLTPMGEYQELLAHVFEHNALDLILRYINLTESRDSRLAFEALKYLAALLCHKKFSIEFINMNGLQKLLEIPRPSIAATGMSMCLYYLAYCEEAMERVCLLPQHVLTDLARYSLWLLECCHESGRCHATMFFGFCFQFRVILELFDMQDGLRKLYNEISTLSILSVEDQSLLLNDDAKFASHQTVRHVCVALKKYFEAHLAIKAEQHRRIHIREQGGSPQPPVPMYKAAKYSPEQIQEQIEILLEFMPLRANWSPVKEFLRLGGVTLLLQVIAMAYDWNYSGRAETVRSALDVLAVCAVNPNIQLLFCEMVELPDDASTVGMNILLGAAEGEIVADPDVQRAALNVIIDCVCAPLNRVGGSIGRFSVAGSATKKRNTGRSGEDLLNKMWECVRSNNGIMVLLQLMMVKTPITDADSIRALACCALVGLARSETVQQIMGKLGLFTSGQMQILMREPILYDKRLEHVKFQKYALELLERVSGKMKCSMNECEVSLATIHRADVVAQTRILYNEKQLFQLIHQYLLSKSLSESASVLQKEAGLPGTLLKQGTGSNFPPYRTVATPPQPPRASRIISGATASPRAPLTAINTAASRNLVSASTSSSHASTLSDSSSAPPTASLPIRVSISSRKSERSQPTSVRSLQKSTYADYAGSSPVLKSAAHMERQPDNAVTLDSIVTDYLLNQHALCKNPMVTCPQFNLFVPHKCPDPKSKNTAPTNFTTRINRRSVFPPFGGPEGAKLDRKLVYSRFRPIRSFRQSEDESFFTCCAFSPCEQFMVMGTYQGEVKMFNLHTGSEEATYQCHDSYVYSIEPNRDGSLYLTSCTWRMPLSAIWWAGGEQFEMKHSFEEEEYVEFSKLTEDRIIGTKAERATIYDVQTGAKILALLPQSSNQYAKNRATFNPTDELVLSDGVLWDVASGKQIHKFDKLNQNLGGVFHPNGLEIVSNSEVWDLRTFHLLKTVPALDQCQISFSHSGDILFGVMLEQETEEETSYENSFKTLDATDYSSIATIDVKKNIYGLCCNKYDSQLAIVENQGMYDSVNESTVRLYDIGRLRDDEDEMDEEEEDEDMDGSEEGTEGSDNEEEEQGDDNNADNAEDNAEEDNNGDNNDDDDDDSDDDSSGSGSAISVTLSTEGDDDDDDDDIRFSLSDL